MTSKNKQSPLIGIGLIKIADDPTCQLVIQILEQAGIQPVCEGGLGWIEICVSHSRSADAVALLSAEPALKGKIFSSNHKFDESII